MKTRLAVFFFFLCFSAFALDAQYETPSNLQVVFINNGKASAYIQWLLAQGYSTSPSAIYFSTPPVGYTVTAAVTLLNNGPSTIQLLPLTMSGINAKDFTFLSHCPTYLQYRAPTVPPGGKIEANQRCQIDITFKPSAPGARFATFTVPFAGLSASAPASLQIDIAQVQPPTRLSATVKP